jgi:hypothetical protein
MAAKRSNPSGGASKSRSAKSTPVASTRVRNTARPKVPVQAAPAARPEVTPEMIAKRAYEIWQSGTGGSDLDNWCRAERELRGV